MSTRPPTISGLVTAAGPASPADVDVALLRVSGVRIIDHVVAALRPLCDDVTVVTTGRGVPDLPAGVRSIDVDAQTQVELLAAALPHAAHELVAVVDSSLLTPDPGLLDRLRRLWTGERGIVASSPSGPEPFHALWTRGSAPALHDHGGRPLDAAHLQALGVTVLDELHTATLVSHDRWAFSAAPPPETIDLT